MSHDFEPTDAEKEGWIIERLCTKTNEWVKWVTIPGQLEQDFDPEPTT